MRTELDVPFSHKDEAKALGAKWDRAKKIWYVPDGVNPEPFAAWLPGVDRSDPSAPYIYLVLGKRECWKCHEQTTVAAFGIPYRVAEDSGSKAAPGAAPATDDAGHIAIDTARAPPKPYRSPAPAPPVARCKAAITCSRSPRRRLHLRPSTSCPRWSSCAWKSPASMASLPPKATSTRRSSPGHATTTPSSTRACSRGSTCRAKLENRVQISSKIECENPRKSSMIILENRVCAGSEVYQIMISYGSEQPKSYRPRLLDERLQTLLQIFGAVEIRGTKWCGKSWTALAFGESVVHLDDPNVKSLVEADPSLALQGNKPHVIDEWQETPATWDATRRAVDASGGKKGLFILTGSSTPAKDSVTHSGAGRIARLDMSTMTLWERGLSTGSVSLQNLFEGSFEPSAYTGSLPMLADAICCGGWPALVGASPQMAAEVVNQYLDAMYEVSVPQKGGVGSTARHIVSSLARNVATSATLNTIAADASLGDSDAQPATSTVAVYLDMLESMYAIVNLPGWDAPVRAKSRLRTKPKRYFADPSIPAAALGMNPERLLADGQTFGLLFESLCIHDLSVYTSCLPGSHPGSLHYYGDSDGLEVDAIIELNDGRWAAIEIKLGESKVSDGIRNIERLRRKVALNPAARNPQPEFCAVITATSPFCRYDAEHDVYVFPIGALRA